MKAKWRKIIHFGKKSCTKSQIIRGYLIPLPPYCFALLYVFRIQTKAPLNMQEVRWLNDACSFSTLIRIHESGFPEGNIFFPFLPLKSVHILTSVFLHSCILNAAFEVVRDQRKKVKNSFPGKLVPNWQLENVFLQRIQKTNATIYYRTKACFNGYFNLKYLRTISRAKGRRTYST